MCHSSLKVHCLRAFSHVLSLLDIMFSHVLSLDEALQRRGGDGDSDSVSTI